MQHQQCFIGSRRLPDELNPDTGELDVLGYKTIGSGVRQLFVCVWCGARRSTQITRVRLQNICAVMQKNKKVQNI